MNTTKLVALLTVSLALAAAGCGDDGATTTTTPAAPTTAAVAATSVPPTTTTGPTTTLPAATTAPPTTIPVTTTAGTGDVVDAATAAAVRAALAAGSEVPTGRLEGSFEMIGLEGAPLGTTVAFTFSGAFDNTVPAMSFVMDLSDLAAVAGDEIPAGFEDLFSEMEIRQIGDVSYMRFPFFQQLGGVATEWVSFPSGSDDPTQSFVAGTPGNPAELLGVFEDAGATVLDAGPDPIRGFDTTRYVLVFDVEELTASADPDDLATLEELGPLGLDEFSLDVWIDAAGLLHRFAMTFDGTTLAEGVADAGFEQMTMRFDILDHGDPVVIEAPPAGEVTDGEGLGLFG